MDGDVVQECELPVDRVSYRTFVVGIHPIPFVHGDGEGTAGVEDHSEQTRVLIGDALGRVQHDDDHVGGRDGLE